MADDEQQVNPFLYDEEELDKGKGTDAHLYSPKDPQWWFAGSTHPYAPFVGNALVWESHAYDDGTT